LSIISYVLDYATGIVSINRSNTFFIYPEVSVAIQSGTFLLIV